MQKPIIRVDGSVRVDIGRIASVADVVEVGGKVVRLTAENCAGASATLMTAVGDLVHSINKQGELPPDEVADVMLAVAGLYGRAGGCPMALAEAMRESAAEQIGKTLSVQFRDSLAARVGA